MSTQVFSQVLHNLGDQDIKPNTPPHPPAKAKDGKESWAYWTCQVRWPGTLNDIIKEIEKEIESISNNEDNKKDNSEKIEEGKKLVEEVCQIVKELNEDAKLTKLKEDSADWKLWNEQLENYWKDATWHSASWLFSECYMYRRVRNSVLNTKHWKTFDVFFGPKTETFFECEDQVLDLANKFGTILKFKLDKKEQRVMFHELAQTSLWGNGQDLSLLATMAEEDAKKLQEAGKNLEEQEKCIVVNHLEHVWNQLCTIKNKRIDFVCDNAGFEQYVDLLLADWLVSEGFASHIVFNLKGCPWFVSDTMPSDFHWIINECINNQQGNQNLTHLGKTWKGYLDTGVWIIKTHPFWTTGISYWHLPEASPDLHKDLQQSSMIFFKGDLNFRKLTYDCRWPVTTTFQDGIGPLGKDFPPVVSLRTNKADVIVGIKNEERAKELSKADPKWKTSGKFAVVMYSPGSTERRKK